MRLAGTAATRFTLSRLPVARSPHLPRRHQRAGLHSTACPTSASPTTCAIRAGAATSPPAAMTARPAARPVAISCASAWPWRATASPTRASRPPAAARRSPPPALRWSSSAGAAAGRRRVGSPAVAAELGGLSAGKLHAADLAADALRAGAGRGRAPTAPCRRLGGRTLVAMSGGVDSAVAALLADGEVVAVTLELWRDPENDGERSCCSADAVRGARALAHRLGLPHLTLDLRDEFRAGVVEPWLDEHAAGQTPNPCVGCNGEVRLDAMLALADRVGAATLTTGHYARRSPDGLLRLAADPAKDQAYMLAGLAPRALARLRFPLGDLTKPEVREIAREHGLPVAGKADSQDLCFLAGTGRRRFLARHGAWRAPRGRRRPRRAAPGRPRRRHHHFTVGQRRGLGVGGAGEPLYVLATDARANTVTVGARARPGHRRRARARTCACTASRRSTRSKLRYRSPRDALRAGRRRAVAWRARRRPAPGQIAVLLGGDVVVGCATIVA